MGIVRRILGFDKHTIEGLKSRVGQLEADCARLEAMRDAVENIIERINNIEERIAGLKVEVGEANARLNIHDKGIKEIAESYNTLYARIEEIEEEINELKDELSSMTTQTDEDVDEKVLEAIQRGYTTPTEIIEATGLNKNKVYSVLKRLVDNGVLAKQREGRHVHYTIIQHNDGDLQLGEAST